MTGITSSNSEAAEHARSHKAERLSRARWLWSRRRPVFASIAQTYLAAPGYRGTIPATPGLLPASRGYPAALIAVYGTATETVPGGIASADDAVMGVHTRPVA